jgi:hypothetical protein
MTSLTAPTWTSFSLITVLDPLADTARRSTVNDASASEQILKNDTAAHADMMRLARAEERLALCREVACIFESLRK